MSNANRENKSCSRVRMKLNDEIYVHVRTKFPLKVFSEYPILVDKYGMDKPRELFCSIVHLLVEEEIDRESIFNIDYEELMKLGQEFINNNKDYYEFFIKQGDKNDFFEKFMSAFDSYYRYNLEKLKKILKDSLDMLVFPKKIAEIIAPLQKMANEMVSNFSKMVSELVSNFPKLKFENDFYKILNEIKEFCEKIGDIENKFAAIMLELDWPPPIDLPLDMAINIIKEYDSISDKKQVGTKIREILIDYYDNEVILDMLNSWKNKKLLEKRIHILDAAITAHCSGNYILSIPALFPQIEGIVVEGFNYTGYMGGKRFKDFISQLLKEDGKSSINQVVYQIITCVIWQSFQYGDSISSSINRNAILHGADVNYGTKENSLKVILLFHYLQDAIDNKNKIRLIKERSENNGI